MYYSKTGLTDIKKTILKKEIEIKYIHSFFYFEHPKDFVFKGERHNFWELTYIDTGEAEVMAGEEGYRLQQGDIIFHKPKEFHSIWANKKNGPNIVVITFDSKSEAMRFFDNKIISLNNQESDLLSCIVKYGKEMFLDYGGREVGMIRNENMSFGCEQLFKNHLEEFLVKLIRSGKSEGMESRLHVIMKDRVEDDIVKNIIFYMEKNINKNLAFKDICKVNMVSETHLKVLFKEKMGISAMKYFKKMKIDEAKRMIRDEACNITQIAQTLGYASIHYFSKSFKEVTDMTPTEYASSVEARFKFFEYKIKP